MNEIEKIKAYQRLRRQAGLWKRTSKQQNKTIRELRARLGSLTTDLEDSRRENEQRLAENEILKAQVEQLVSWTERWQAIMEADTAVMSTRKIQASQELRRPDTFE